MNLPHDSQKSERDSGPVGLLPNDAAAWREQFANWVSNSEVSGIILDEPAEHDARKAKWTHVALWSSVAVVAIGCGFLVWHHEHDKAFRLQVTALNKAVQTAVDDGNGSAIEDAYAKLIQAIGNRPISSRVLDTEVKQTLMRVVPIIDQVKQYRLECHEFDLVEARKRAEIESEENRKRLVNEANNRPAERYYFDGKDFISESEKERTLSKFRSNIYSTSNEQERAYKEGYLRALESEWEQIKTKGAK